MISQASVDSQGGAKIGEQLAQLFRMHVLLRDEITRDQDQVGLKGIGDAHRLRYVLDAGEGFQMEIAELHNARAFPRLTDSAQWQPVRLRDDLMPLVKIGIRHAGRSQHRTALNDAAGGLEKSAPIHLFQKYQPAAVRTGGEFLLVPGAQQHGGSHLHVATPADSALKCHHHGVAPVFPDAGIGFEQFLLDP